MTTETDITLLPLPPRDHVVAILGDQAIGHVQTWNEKSMREYGAACARAAVEDDRRGPAPSILAMRDAADHTAQQAARIRGLERDLDEYVKRCEILECEIARLKEGKP